MGSLIKFKEPLCFYTKIAAFVTTLYRQLEVSLWHKIVTGTLIVIYIKGDEG